MTNDVTRAYNYDTDGIVTALLLTMNTTTNSTNATTAKMLENVVADRYDVNAIECDAIVIEWAAEQIAKTHGVAVAAKEWKRVNARRYRLGRYTTIPQYGTAIYAAYFA